MIIIIIIIIIVVKHVVTTSILVYISSVFGRVTWLDLVRIG